MIHHDFICELDTARLPLHSQDANSAAAAAAAAAAAVSAADDHDDAGTVAGPDHHPSMPFPLAPYIIPQFDRPPFDV